MKSIGIIGLGSMGGMMLDRFIAGGTPAGNICAATHNPQKLAQFAARYPGLKTGSNLEAAKSDIVFICVEPGQFKDVLLEILPALSESSHIGNIASTVTIANVESLIPCKVTKLVPTITSKVGRGVTLVSYNDKITPQDKQDISGLFAAFGELQELPEGDLAYATELTSCGPGLYAYILGQIASAAQKYTDTVGEAEIRRWLMETFAGTIALAEATDMTFDEIVSGVATRGGITEEGVRAMADMDLNAVFDAMFRRTLEKRARNEEKTNSMYEAPKQ